MIIPIAIKGTSGEGQPFKENTWTIGINKQGARIASFHRLTVGDEIVIENPLLGHTARARVIRVGEKRFPEDPYEVGVELLEKRNVWGVKFPPEDWKAGAIMLPPRERTSGRTGAAETAPRSSEAPPAPKAPAASEPAAPEKSAQFNMAIKALSQLAKQTEGILPPETEGEALPRQDAGAAQPEGAETETKAASEEQKKAVDRQLGTLAEQVRAARQGLEALVEKLHEFHDARENEVAQVRELAQQASAQALEAALVEARDQVKRDADAAAWKSLDDARRRMEEEARRSADAFRENAAQAASRVLDERVATLAPLLDAMVASSAGRIKDEIEKKIENMEPELKAATQKSAEKLAASLLERASQALDEKVKAALTGLDRTLDQALAKRLEAIQLEGNRVAAGLQAAHVQAGEEPRKALAKQGADAVASVNAATDAAREKLQATLQVLESDLEGKVADFRKQMGDASASALDGFQNYLGDMVKNFEEQLQKSTREQPARAAEAAAAEVKKSTAEALEAGKSQLHRQAEDFLELFNHELMTAGQKNLEQARAEVRELGRAAADQLGKDAKAREASQALLEASARQVMEGTGRELARVAEITVNSLREAMQKATESYRGQLHSTLDESVSRSTRDLETFLDNILEGRRAGVAAEVQKQADEAAARAVAEMKGRAEAAATAATDQVLKQVGLATMVLKDWGDQATARMEASFQKSLETFKARIELIASSTAEEQRRRSTKTATDLLHRLKQAAQALETSEGPEPPSSEKSGR